MQLCFPITHETCEVGLKVFVINKLNYTNGLKGICNEIRELHINH